MLSEVPEEWSRTTLGEVTTVKARIGWRGLSAGEYTDDGPFLIAGKHIKSGVIDWASCDHLSTFRYEQSPEIQLQTGDVIFSKDGSIGNPALIENLPGSATINGTMMMVRPHSDHLVPSYLYQVVGGSDFYRMIREKVSGSSIPHIFQRDIVHFPVVLPPLSEQRRIAEVLRSVDEAMAAADAVIEQLRRARSHRLEALMTLPGTYRRIDQICRLSGGYGFPIKHQGKSAGRYPFAKVSDMNRPGNEVQMRYAESYVDDADLQTLKAKTFPPGTTFFPKVGATLLTNKRRIAAVEMLVDNNVMGAVATDVDPWFLYYAFCTIDMADYVQPGAVPSVNQRTIGQIMIPIPAKAEQEEFARSMRDLDTAIERQTDALLQLNTTKAAVASDLLSGRVRVPASGSAPARTVPPAFKRAVFAAEIVQQLHNDDRFGSVKHEKIVHLCELHLNLQGDLDRHAYKKAAGPYDPAARRSVEQIFRQQNWFRTTKPDGKRVVYLPLEKAGGHHTYFDRYFGDKKAAIQSIIDLLRPLDTERCEIVATLYAVWNDFLIDRQEPTDDEIVASVLNDWHPSKRQIAESRWRSALPWMRQHHLIPKGHGEKTRTANE